MAEASTETPPDTQLSDSNSQNGAAGPPSLSIDDSLEDEVSIHLSPRSTRKGPPSPRATKTSARRAKLQAAQQQQLQQQQPVRTGLARKPSNVKRSSSMKGQGRVMKAAMSEDEQLQPSGKCDMCDEQKVIKARCLECQASMCSDCLEYHRKMKISAGHDIQSWDTVSQTFSSTPAQTLASTAKSKQNCKIHQNEKLQFYCKVCQTPLCINCKLTKHEGHKTRDLMEEIAEQRENLPYKLSQLRASFIPLLKQQMKDIEDHGTQVAQNVKATIETAEKRKRVLKEEIDRTGNRIVEKLKQTQSKEGARVDQRKQIINGHIKSATTALTTGERVAQSGNDFEVMEVYQNLLKMIKQMSEVLKKRPGKTRYMFHDGQFSQVQLQTMFGSFSENGAKEEKAPSAVIKKSSMALRPIPAIQIIPEVQARLLKTFKCKMVPGNKVSAIAPINDKEAWISFGWTTNEIYLYNKDGFRRNRLLLRQPVDDIAVDHDGNLIISTFTGSIVRLVDRRLQIRDLFQCPLRARGVTVSGGGEIIVCGVDMCTALPPPLKCTIFKYNSRGNNVGHLDGDKTKRVPIHPYRVAENIDGSIAISDWVSDKEGRVVVFAHDGRVRMVYYGNRHDKRSFLPYGICTDRYGHIIVSDIISQEVHLLDINGHFLRVLLSREDLDNERPYTVAVDHMGTLWVGNERAQIKIFRYLVNQSHIVDPFPSSRSHKDDQYWTISDDDLTPRQFRLKYPGAVASHWNKQERKVKPPVYKDVPDLWKWK